MSVKIELPVIAAFKWLPGTGFGSLSNLIQCLALRGNSLVIMTETAEEEQAPLLVEWADALQAHGAIVLCARHVTNLESEIIPGRHAEIVDAFGRLNIYFSHEPLTMPEGFKLKQHFHSIVCAGRLTHMGAPRLQPLRQTGKFHEWELTFNRDTSIKEWLELVLDLERLAEAE